jgi:hypothetical protein
VCAAQYRVCNNNQVGRCAGALIRALPVAPSLPELGLAETTQEELALQPAIGCTPVRQ